jgi:5-amino-6-(5-phosphoribosylamino)uracil reductase
VRPRILVNFASSIDGKINPTPERRPPRFVMSRAREDLDRLVDLRSRGDAILIGASNLRADNPDLTVNATERARRRDARQAEPLRIVVTTVGEGLSPDMKMFDPAGGGPAVVAHAARMPAATRHALERAARLVELGEDWVDIDRLLAWLVIDAGVETVVCEGGGDLVARLFAARAVDELFLTVVPRILGGGRAPTLAGGPGFDPDQIPDPHLGSLERVGDELFLRYDFNWS